MYRARIRELNSLIGSGPDHTLCDKDSQLRLYIHRLTAANRFIRAELTGPCRRRTRPGDDALLTTCLAKGDSGPDDNAARRFCVPGEVESEFFQTHRANKTIKKHTLIQRFI